MNEESPGPPRWVVAPYFVVADVVAAASFYRDRLGFRFDLLWGDPPRFTIVHRRGASIMLSQIEGAQPRPNRLGDPEGEAWDAYLWVDDADRLHDELAAKGVEIVRGLCDQPYRSREFEVEDLDGYRLCFAHSLPER